MHVNKIDDKTKSQPIQQIADSADENQNKRQMINKRRVPIAPDYDEQSHNGDHGKNRQRPALEPGVLVVQHAENHAPVFDIGEFHKTVDDGNIRSLMAQVHGRMLCRHIGRQAGEENKQESDEFQIFFSGIQID